MFGNLILLNLNNMKKIIWLLTILFISVSCEKDSLNEYPLIQTGDVTDISSEGAVFNAKIIDLSTNDIMEYGFVWDIDPNPTILKSEKFIIRESPRVGIVSEQISTTLQVGVMYHVRAFVRSTEFITYGKQVAFTSSGSLAPHIIDFAPKTANLGDTILIIGENFSYKPYNNKVQIDEFSANVIKASQDTLMVIVPTCLNILSSKIAVSIFQNKTTSTESFRLIAPEITDFHSKTGTFGSIITIEGNNFLANPESLYVWFDDFRAQITEIQNQYIKVIVPDNLDKSQFGIKVSMNNMNVFSLDKFQLESFSLDYFYPESANTGGIITLVGNNFSSIKEYNKVAVGGLSAVVTKASLNELEVILPLQNEGIYASRNIEITVERFDEEKEFNQSILIEDQWLRIADFPGTESYLANCFVVNDKAYIGLNSTNQFWCFNPETLVWERKADFIGENRSEGAGFYLDGSIYFGTGLSDDRTNLTDFWAYDVNSDSWSSKKDFIGPARKGASGFSIGEKGYLTSGNRFAWSIYYHPYGDNWEYNPATDKWLEIPSYGDLEWGGVDGVSGGSVVVINGIAYFGIGWNYSSGSKRVYTFNPSENDEWKRITNFPEDRNTTKGIAFVLNDEPYFKTVNSNFYRYDVSTDSWFPIETKIVTDIRGGIGFSIGGKVYVGLGIDNTMWEYDPSK